MQKSFKQTATHKGQDFHGQATLSHNKSLLETPGTVKDKFQYLQVKATDWQELGRGSMQDCWRWDRPAQWFLSEPHREDPGGTGKAKTSCQGSHIKDQQVPRADKQTFWTPNGWKRQVSERDYRSQRWQDLHRASFDRYKVFTKKLLSGWTTWRPKSGSSYRATITWWLAILIKDC